MAKQAQVPLAAVIKPLARLPPEEVSLRRAGIQWNKWRQWCLFLDGILTDMQDILVGQDGTVFLYFSFSGPKLGSSSRNESKSQINDLVRPGFKGGNKWKESEPVDVEAHTCNCSTQETKTGDLGVLAQPGYTVDSISKQTKDAEAGRFLWL